MTFKILALAPQIYVTDANGQDLLYVRQQLFRLKEKIDVYRDSKQSSNSFKLALIASSIGQPSIMFAIRKGMKSATSNDTAPDPCGGALRNLYQ